GRHSSRCTRRACTAAALKAAALAADAAAAAAATGVALAPDAAATGADAGVNAADGTSTTIHTSQASTSATGAHHHAARPYGRAFTSRLHHHAFASMSARTRDTTPAQLPAV